MNERDLFSDSDCVQMMYTAYFQNWLYGLNGDSFKHNILEQHKILCDNRQYLKDTLGKQAFCYNDFGCRRCYVWRIELPCGNMWIVTARERGTSIEIDFDLNVDTFSEVMTALTKIFDLDFKDETGNSIVQ